MSSMGPPTRDAMYSRSTLALVLRLSEYASIAVSQCVISIARATVRLLNISAFMYFISPFSSFTSFSRAGRLGASSTFSRSFLRAVFLALGFPVTHSLTDPYRLWNSSYSSFSFCCSSRSSSSLLFFWV